MFGRLESARFKGVFQQPNGKWGAHFYARGTCHKAAHDEDYEELAAFQLWEAVETYAKKYPNAIIRYKMTSVRKRG